MTEERVKARRRRRGPGPSSPGRICCAGGGRPYSLPSRQASDAGVEATGCACAGAILALICCVLIIHYDFRIDRAIAQVIHPPPRSITWLVTVVYDVGSFGITIALVLLALIARRWVVARDIALSAAAAAAVSGILILVLGGRGEQAQRNRDPRVFRELPGPPDRSVHGGHHGGAAVSGPGPATSHRDLHRARRDGLSRRRSRAAAQRAGQPGHRVGDNGTGPAGLRLPARPPLGR